MNKGLFQGLNAETPSVTYKEGLVADRPNPSTTGLIYYATDTKNWFWDTGNSWVLLPSAEVAGGDLEGSLPAPTVVGVQGVGISPTQATWFSQQANIVTRYSSGTLEAGEISIFTGSIPSQTLSLPLTSSSIGFNTIINIALVSVSVAPTGGNSLNVNAITGNVTLFPGQTLTVLPSSGYWFGVSNISPTPSLALPVSFNPTNPTGTASTSLVMMGLGSTINFTPLFTGNVKINLVAYPSTATGVAAIGLATRYGTGSSPTNGQAGTGTNIPGSSFQFEGSSANQVGGSYVATGIIACSGIAGFTLGTSSLWIDLALDTSNALDSAKVSNVMCTLEEIP